ncbi:peptidoglycan-binding protein [uncultured Clostridium sp.]|uniref:peptidoglycan-binding protein n=1 Tax=uncultured Clostridium sp. TaxID=59620 RepID=UPI002619606A|nr:peptidoglycan-binding protein [uncultured Clostridium sp.]
MLLQLGDIGDNVKYLQYGLHILCCSPNGFDGEFGEGTRIAVTKFQTKYGLVSDGIIGDFTWDTLRNEISTIQSQLNKKGYNVGVVDGLAGEATYNAIISFQTKHGLTADGQVGPTTWDVLFDSVSGGNSYSRILKLTSPLMYGEDVRAVQNKLNSLGYVAGTADGYFGNMTREAVINFQSAKGLSADGEVGPNTWNILFNTSTSGGSGYNRILKLTAPLMYGEDIINVQNKLNSLGYNVGIADGYYGEATRSAVMNFQSTRGLDADGEVGPTTWNTLFGTLSSEGNGVTSNMKKIFIDPGHGGSDPGASGNGLDEKNVVLSISKKIGNILVSKGFEVRFSRSTDIAVSLSDRSAQANAWGADLFVSIHCNSATASSANGTECYTHPTVNSSTKLLSKNMASALANRLGLTNRGHKEANFAVLRLSNMPSILIETAFINNSGDANKLKTREDEFASVIANQIANTSIDGSTGGSSNGNTSSEYSRDLEVTSPLMYGEDVRAVQNKLNSLGFNCGTPDGYYGNDTKNAVIKLQMAFGITADGIVGPTTWKFIFNSSPINEIIKEVNKIGLFEGANLEIEAFNTKTPPQIINFDPIVKVQFEASFTNKLGNSPNNFINIAYSKDTIATNLFNSLNTAGVEHSLTKGMIASSISKLVAARNINDIIKYYIALENDGTLMIILEGSVTSKTYSNLKLASTLYQRVIITVTPSLFKRPGLRPQAVLTTPVGMKLSDVPAGSNIDYSKVFDLGASILFTGIVLLIAYLGSAELVGAYKLIEPFLKKIIWVIS